ncbi:hypothetical protein J2Y03_001879 [Neobacillus niacini]|nr:hypothetical protein [Neobacillus niacini]
MVQKLKWLFFSVCIVLLTPNLVNAQVIHEVKYGDSLAKISKQYKYEQRRTCKA